MDSLPSRVLYLSLTRGVCVFPWILYHVNDPLPGFRFWLTVFTEMGGARKPQQRLNRPQGCG